MAFDDWVIRFESGVSLNNVSNMFFLVVAMVVLRLFSYDKRTTVIRYLPSRESDIPYWITSSKHIELGQNRKFTIMQ